MFTYIDDWEYMAHVDVDMLHPAEACLITGKNGFAIVHNIDDVKRMFHTCDILKILVIPACNADVADSGFQGHSWLCVNWKSTPADLLCPIKTPSVNLASPLHHLRYPPTACPQECVHSWTGFSFHLFLQCPHYCEDHPHLPRHTVGRLARSLDYNSC